MLMLIFTPIRSSQNISYLGIGFWNLEEGCLGPKSET
jgi:hypothetical protein